MFKKKEVWNKPFSEKVAKRVKNIPTGELTLWLDQAMFDLGRSINQYERSKETVILDNALLGAEAIHAVVNELHTRMTKV
jgi:hypothetical protein